MKGSLFTFGCGAGSFLLNPRVDWSIAQNTDLTLYGGITVGGEDGQFARGVYSALGRVTVYF